MTPTAVVRARLARGDRARRGERPRHDHARRRPQRGEPRPGDPPERRGVHAREHVPRRRPGDRTPPACSTTGSTRGRVQPTQGADYTAVNPRSRRRARGRRHHQGVELQRAELLHDARLARRERPGGVRPAGGEDRRGDRRRSTPTSSASSRSRTTATPPSSTLVAALNERVGAGTYDFIDTGKLGTDVDHDGAHLQARGGRLRSASSRVLDSTVDPDFDTDVQPSGAGADLHRPRRPAARSRSS